MSPEIQRLKELGGLIRAAQAELAVRLSDLTKAHEQGYNPAELGIDIANRGRQICAWQREQENLFKQIVGEEEAASLSSAVCSRMLARLKPESLNKRRAQKG